MLLINRRRLKKRYAIGGSGILDSILKFLVRTFTSQTAKQLATTAAVEAGKKLISKKLDDIVSKYTGNGNVIAIQDMVRKLNGSGLKII